MLFINLKRVTAIAIMGISFSLFLTSCSKEVLDTANQESEISGLMNKSDQADKMNTFHGPQVQVGDGKARSFITISHTGVPQELGVEMTKGALTGISGDHHSTAFLLPLHQKAQAATPFDHIVVNWNEHGHPPFELFSAQHFDFHFYTIPLAERLAIPAYIPGGPHDNLPAPLYRPAGYIATPGGEAQMGKHWADIVNPVLPGTFTHTMVYGSFNGKLTFTEPMITRAFLQSGTEVHVPYRQPTLFAETGTYYPTVYNISRDASGKHYITLTNFVLR